MEEELARRMAIEAAEAERRAVIETALARIPSQAREVPLSEIGLSTRVMGHLERAELVTVWDVLEQSAEGDEGLLKLDGIGPKSLAEIKQCIDALALPEAEALPEEEIPEEEAIVEAKAPEVEAEAELALPAEEEAAAEAEEEVEEPVVEVAVEAEAPEAAEEIPAEEAPVEPEQVAAEILEPSFEEEDEELEVLSKDQKQQKKRKHRELVYDEDLGEVVAFRRRKRGDEVDELSEWDEYLK
jgi:hypothetical protein